MLKVGLTGGIGSGKSTVASIFAELGTPQIDADVIAHELVKPGQPALFEIALCFGQKILTDKGLLDRKILKNIVFADTEKKRQLESILHPLVYREIIRQSEQIDDAYIIISIPLLIETNMQQSIDRILVVDCPVELQLSRAAQRDHLSKSDIQSIIDTQSPREQRLAEAHDILNSDCSLQQLAERVKKLHNSYLLHSKQS
jgi:dephospho-CoA kinase